MKRLLVIAALAASSAYAQPVFVQAKSGDGTTAATSTTTAAITTTTGNLLHVFFGLQTGAGCNSMLGSSALTGTPTLTGATFVPIAPSSGGVIIGARITNAGSGYTTDPTINIVGGGGTGGQITGVASGGVLAAVQLAAIGSGYTSVPTLTVTGGGGSGATAEVVAIGVGNTSSCTSSGYANITGSTGSGVTLNHPSFGYRGVTVEEWSGLDNTSPLDTSIAASSGAATSIATGAFSTAQASEALICGSRVEAISQTWTAGSTSACADGGGSCTIPTGATVTATFLTSQYKILSNIQSSATASIASGSSAVRVINCSAFKAAAAAPVAYPRKRTVVR